MKIGMISLGCPKNLVDSERMLGLLGGNDYQITSDPDDADVMPEIENPANRWDEIWDYEYLEYLNGMALAEVKRKVSPKQYQIFHLYCIKELTVEKIAEILDVSPNEVYLAKNRVTPIYEGALRKSLDEIGAA